jgi:23S rRNA pseudouridine2605 synthase
MATQRRNTVTLVRALSKLGVLSRTQAAAAIAAGRVTVAGKVERDPERWLDPERSAIALDGRRVTRQDRVVLALHKPAGVVTTRADERGRRTAYDLLPGDLPFVAAVGRLDLDSSGLLLFTNDTQLAARISAPGAAIAKVYEVTFDAPLSDVAVARMVAGMQLDDGTRLLPVGVEVVAADRTRARFTLHEGKNRQIRRMAESAGVNVVRLHRVAIGPVRLGGLAESHVRPLTPAELRELQAWRGR